jgi:mannose/fructose-specific phosphotransferase system component IIA
MNDAEATRGVVVSHGTLAFALVDAVRRIAGVQDDGLDAVSNEGLSREALCAAVEAAAGPGPAVIFTDMGTGSCAVAARLVCRGEGRRVVVSGVNLPMLLDFVFHRDMPLQDLVLRLLEKARGAVDSTLDAGSHVHRSPSG